MSRTGPLGGAAALSCLIGWLVGASMSVRSAAGSARYRVQVTTSFEDAEQVWRALEHAGDAMVFQTFDWQAAWFRHVGRRQAVRLCIVIVRRVGDDRPVMLLPLGIVRRGPGRVLTWLGGALTDYNGPVLAHDAAARFDRRDIEALWRQICGELPGFDYAHFERQPAEIGGQDNPFRLLSTRTNPISGSFTRLGPSWASYYSGKRGAETRRKERRKEKKLLEQGPLDFVIARTSAEIDLIIEAMIAQKSASYERKGVRNLFRDPVYADFLRTFTLAFAESGLVVLAAVKQGNAIIAAQWGLVHRDRFYCLVLSRDHGRFARYSPGNILMRRLMQWCCERGISIFDFTYGDESYKDHWCEGRVTLADSLLPSTLRGGAFVLAIGWRDAVYSNVRRSSRLHGLAVGLRRIWSKFWPAPHAPAARGHDAAEEQTPSVANDWKKA